MYYHSGSKCAKFIQKMCKIYTKPPYIMNLLIFQICWDCSYYYYDYIYNNMKLQLSGIIFVSPHPIFVLLSFSDLHILLFSLILFLLFCCLQVLPHPLSKLFLVYQQLVCYVAGACMFKFKDHFNFSLFYCLLVYDSTSLLVGKWYFL